MTSQIEAALAEQDNHTAEVRPLNRSGIDRFMRKLLLVDGSQVSEGQSPTDLESSAHRYLRTSMIISGVRCLITYLLIPIAVPIIGLSGLVAAPVGVLLSMIAVASGIVSLRKFWASDHRLRWMYSIFIFIVFAVVAVMLYFDISTIVRSI